MISFRRTFSISPGGRSPLRRGCAAVLASGERVALWRRSVVVMSPSSPPRRSLASGGGSSDWNFVGGQCPHCGVMGALVVQHHNGRVVQSCNKCLHMAFEITGEAASLRKTTPNPESAEVANGAQKSDAAAADPALTPAPEVSLRAKGIPPREIHKVLDEFVIGQERAKRLLAVAVYNHYKRLQSVQDTGAVMLEKSNILMLGPTGCGKTLLAKTLARTFNVPFALADCTTLTQAGYVGEDVESILFKLLQAADFNVERAQRGIVFLDEVDKIGAQQSGGTTFRDVGGQGVQQALLKLLEGTVVSVPEKTVRRSGRSAEAIQIDTTNILFIASGAFTGLENIVDSIGFHATVKNKSNVDVNAVRHTEPADLIKYGLIPEFVGRFPAIATLDALDEAALVRVLSEPKNSLVAQFTALFALDDVVSLELSDGARLAIAKKAVEKKTGARGLRSIMESLLMEAMYETPGSTIARVLVSESVVLGQSLPTYVQRQVPEPEPETNVQQSPAAASASDTETGTSGGGVEATTA